MTRPTNKQIYVGIILALLIALFLWNSGVLPSSAAQETPPVTHTLPVVYNTALLTAISIDGQFENRGRAADLLVYSILRCGSADPEEIESQTWTAPAGTPSNPAIFAINQDKVNVEVPPLTECFIYFNIHELIDGQYEFAEEQGRVSFFTPEASNIPAGLNFTVNVTITIQTPTGGIIPSPVP